MPQLNKLGLIAVVVLVLAVVLASVAFLLRGHISRTFFPHTYVISAAANTFDMPIHLVSEILQESWNQEIVLGLNSISGALAPELSPSELAAVRMATFRNSIHWNAQQETYATSTVLQMLVTPMASLNLVLDRESIAFNVPEVFDYYITLGAATAMSQWDNSLAGNWIMPSPISDELFYEWYTNLLFQDFDDFTQSVAEIVPQIEFQYEGQHTINVNDNDKSARAFRLTIPAEAVNNSMELLNNNAALLNVKFAIAIEQDIELMVYIANSRVISIEFAGHIFINEYVHELTITISTDNHNSMQLKNVVIESGGISIAAQWQADFQSHQPQAFNFNTLLDVKLHEGFVLPSAQHWPLTADTFISFGANGSVRTENQRVEAQFSDLSLSFSTDYDGQWLHEGSHPGEWLDLSVNARLMLYVNNSPISSPSNTRAIDDINLLHLMAMYARFEASPISDLFNFLQ